MTDAIDRDDLNTGDTAARAGAGPDDAGTAVTTPPEDERTALRREADALRDKNLRLLADARNLQQRANRDKEEAIRYAEFGFARELLPVLDGLEQTLASAQSGADAQAMLEGARIVYEQFQKVLRAHGVEPITAQDRMFDPTYHEAVMQRPSDQPAGTVLQEVQRGYMMRDRTLRAARVVVSAGPDNSKR